MIPLMEISLGPFVAIITASPTIQNWIKNNTRGITYIGINIETLKNMPIPLPPENEQNRIVLEVERRFSIIEELERLVEINLEKAEHLRQSILKRAFEGKLVPQDPNDEPASKLLERIKAERGKDTFRIERR